MITEIAELNIKKNLSDDFKMSFKEAELIISAMQGYLGHELLKCIEQEDKFLLIVRWKTLEDHTTGFRNSKGYQQWKKKLHHFYDPFPTVQHYKKN